MNVLVTGANGFLGYYLCRQLILAGITVTATGKGACRLPFTGKKFFNYQSMDITNPFEVDAVFEKIKPEVVVHAAAMSKPDECEQHPMKAYIVNVESTISLLINAAQFKSFFVYVSTDFVFDGQSGPYKETDKPRPVNYYGKTKLEAEESVQAYEHAWAIVRTVLVYGKPQAGRQNLLTMVKDALENGRPLKIFDDQYRTPTYVEDLANALITIIQKKAEGIWHISGNETLTPYQMSVAAASYLGLNEKLISKIYKGELIEAAERPPRTGFIIQKAIEELGFQPTPFAEGLKKTFAADD